MYQQDSREFGRVLSGRLQQLLTAGALCLGVTILGGMSDAYAFGEFPKKVPVPSDNPMTPAKTALGKQLYYDPRLSKTGTMSCDSCHRVESNGTDNLPLSYGVFDRLDAPRNTPTVYNAAFNTVQFWDGRANSLEAQAEGPIENPVEMDMHPKLVIDRLEKIPKYRKEFAAVFGGEDPLTFKHVVQAIATFERTLLTPDSPYDRYEKGDKNAMDSAAIAGMSLFRKEGCAVCHAGPMFDNPSPHMGIGFFQKFPTMPQNAECSMYEKKYQFMKDTGRERVTHKPVDKDMFRVPGLRNVALTAPYFHNGSVKTLPTAVRVMAACQLGRKLSSKQVKDIVAFLDSLTGKFPKETLPHLPQTAEKTLLMGVPKMVMASAHNH